MRTFGKCFVITLIATFLIGCDSSDEQNTAAHKASQEVEQMANELWSEVGTPEVTNFQEYKFAKQIMEKRDEKITTFTYMIDRDGEKHPICKSVGYGLPYSTQLTNSKKAVDLEELIGYDRTGYVAGKIPQREPNGLYMPDNVAATWILCQKDGEGYTPVYSEPNIVVSPVPLEELQWK